MDFTSWLEGWISAAVGFFGAQLMLELRDYLRWRRERAKMRLNKEFAETIARQAIEGWTREHHIDPPKP